MAILDLIVIGGGINGVGVARDAAGRGLSVALFEADGLASQTSSRSSKLVHGGLRYLEFGAFGLVRKALGERTVVLEQAPHLGHPLPFLIPIGASGRSPLLLRAGLFLYDHLARRTLPKSEHVHLQQEQAGPAFRKELKQGFRYWDVAMDDARLVIANARDAAARGAEIHPWTPVTRAQRIAEGWEIEAGGTRRAARMLVNASGPFAEMIGRDLLALPDPPRLSLVQGAHIVTHRISRGPDAWLLQQPDGRIVFVIPWQDRFSLIGTTETAVPSAIDPQPYASEIRYLLDAVNRYAATPVTEDDILWRYAGVRPLVAEDGKDARETTREWRLVRHDPHTLSIVGGKLTTYRLLAEDVLHAIAPRTRRWTKGVPLPGGDIPRMKHTVSTDFRIWLAGLKNRYPDYAPEIIDRLAHLFGTETVPMLDAGLGENLGGIFEAELAFLRDREWARSAEDALWRHTRLGLIMPPETMRRVEAFFAAPVG